MNLRKIIIKGIDRHQRGGFTLIELLVVVAVIGILASFILVSFPSAGKKAKDSRVKSAVAQAKKVMVSYYVSNKNSFSGFSTSNEEMVPLYKEAVANSYNNTPMFVVIHSGTGNATSCMYAQLRERDGRTWYCVDSTGVAGVTPLDVNPSTADCIATKAVCPTGTKE